jgi:hypothetical protein
MSQGRLTFSSALLVTALLASACGGTFNESPPSEPKDQLSNSGAVAASTATLAEAASTEELAEESARGLSTWNPPPEGYSFQSAEVGPLYWNSDDGAWWWVSVHNSGDGVPKPLLGRDVRVRVVEIIGSGPESPSAADGSQLSPGSEFAVYVPGGEAKVELTADEIEKAQADIAAVGDHVHNDDEPASEPLTEIDYSRVPSMALTEGDTTLVFLMKTPLLWQDGQQVPVVIGTAGPVFSNWTLNSESDIFRNPVTDRTLTVRAMADLLDSHRHLFRGDLDVTRLLMLVDS